MQDFLHVLEEHRRNCEKQGRYVEAETAKNRLEVRPPVWCLLEFLGVRVVDHCFCTSVFCRS